MIYVNCKTEDCGAKVPAPPEAQVSVEELPGILHKKNYYLCAKCGKVGAYTKDDHLSE